MQSTVFEEDINAQSQSSLTKPNVDIALRPYFAETDKKYVHYLFYSTYYNLVPQAVRIRAQSPYILIPWISLYAIMMKVIPTELSKLGFPSSLLIGTCILITIVVFIGGVIGLSWYTDKFDITNRVIEGIENDLKEPDIYYRGTVEAPRKGNFWVLTLNNEIVGCIGMDQRPAPFFDRSSLNKAYMTASQHPRDAPEVQQAKWKWIATFMIKLDDMIRLTIVGLIETVRNAIMRLKGSAKNTTKYKPRILYGAHKPNEASVRRLAVKLECQDNGLSTVLLKRVAFWAHAHQIDYLYAETDELQTKLAEILVKKHGYILLSKDKIGLFKEKSKFKLDVKLWMSKELEMRAKDKALQARMKEEKELEEFERSYQRTTI
ncbi:hypothetical protein BDF20DRAFT_908146 [Mycotypha africana]|uniref:uncharacterized protein n=1 Tax=Mycotypha africana TaxID=64632 RepID=UPI002300CA6D|nr:uncharacterized protein BDF20DRAFT_908146 [Mycotypha africana]KAI8968504.1 hypothetical protein BDF20DRAFT_908146 [Mycotypha africana]